MFNEKKEYHLSEQLVCSGTSIVADIEDSMSGSFRNDCKARLDIALKEARETGFWLRLLKDSNIPERTAADSMIEDSEELIRILAAILKTIKKA